MEVKTEQDALKLMEKVVARTLPNVLKDSSRNIKYGRILLVDTTSRWVNVQINGSGQVLNGIKYSKGLTPNVGDGCLVMSIDPQNNNLWYAIGIY